VRGSTGVNLTIFIPPHPILLPEGEGATTFYNTLPRDAYRDVSARATHGAVAERVRVRGSRS
jgi:hypothetical protein